MTIFPIKMTKSPSGTAAARLAQYLLIELSIRLRRIHEHFRIHDAEIVG